MGFQPKTSVSNTKLVSSLVSDVRPLGVILFMIPIEPAAQLEAIYTAEDRAGYKLVQDMFISSFSDIRDKAEESKGELLEVYQQILEVQSLPLDSTGALLRMGWLMSSV